MLQRKTLVLALAGLGAFGLSSLAYADNSSFGPYIGAQGGYGWVDYGNFGNVALANNVFNIESYGISNNIPEAVTSTNTSNNDDGVAGRLFLGWQFNPYLALETGYAWFSNNEDKATAVDLYNNVFETEFTNKTSAWDIVGKAILPVSAVTGCPNPFSFYAKAGAAYVNYESEATQLMNGQGYSGSASDNQWVPVAGVGAAYNFNNNLAVDLSYTHYFGSNDTTNANGDFDAPNIDFVALGLSYRFNLA